MFAITHSRIRSGLAALCDAAASLLAPPRCRFCHKALYNHWRPFLCADCLASLPWIDNRACRGCGYPAGPHAQHGDDCQRCRGKRLRLTAAAGVLRYHGGAKSLVTALKFARETRIALPMAGLMAERMRQAEFGHIDFIVPVVLHPARRRSRGFDQAALIGGHLSGLTGLPSRPDLLARLRPTRPQATLRREARLLNMADAFRADPAMEGKSVVLVDDVMTTGATMAACALACRNAGARRVYGLVFAR